MALSNRLNKKLAVYLPIFLSLLILIWLVYPNLEGMTATIKEAKPLWLLFSVICTAGSYICMGLTLWTVLRVLKSFLPFLPTLAITLVSTTVNYFVSSAGLSGFATRMHLLGCKGVPYGASVTSSVISTILIYVALAGIVAVGTILQFMIFPSVGASFWQGLLGVTVVLLFAGLLVLLFFHNRIRIKWCRKIFVWLNMIAFYFRKKRWFTRGEFNIFEQQLNEGIMKITEAKTGLIPVMIAVVGDWLCHMMILYFAFRAVGVKLGVITLITGFALGMLMTIIPILPGGLGAMEAAMTGAFTAMGVDTSAALTASLIFRLLYYILPAFLSLPVYWLLKHLNPSCAISDTEEEVLEEKLYGK